MNREMGFLCEARVSDILSAYDPRGARHWGVSSRRKLHMRVVGVKRALHCLTNSCSRRLIGLRASPLVLFNSDQLLTDVGPVELWATY
jgi:hypothetical protein